MSDVRGLLERISAFRQRLEATPRIIPDAIPMDAVDTPPAVAVPESFRQSLRQITGAANVIDGPVPALTDRARLLLESAHSLLARQRKSSSDPIIAGLLAAKDSSTDPLAAYYR